MTMRLEREKGQWIFTDKEAGYYRELEPSDIYMFMAQFHEWEWPRLVIKAAQANPPPQKPREPHR